MNDAELLLKAARDLDAIIRKWEALEPQLTRYHWARASINDQDKAWLGQHEESARRFLANVKKETDRDALLKRLSREERKLLDIHYSHDEAIKMARGLSFPPALVQSVMNHPGCPQEVRIFLETCQQEGIDPLAACQAKPGRMPDDYHPNLDGPAEPIGLAMPEETKLAPMPPPGTYSGSLWPWGQAGRCKFISPNQIQCRLDEGHPGDHFFNCGKDECCELDDGHEGPCKEIPF